MTDNSQFIDAVKSTATEGSKPKEIILLVAGSRRFNDSKRVTSAIDTWIAKHGRPDKIIHGEAEGVDLLAKMYAQRNSIPCEGYPAKWSGTGRQRQQCGPIRNSKMIAACTHVLAMPSKKYSPGTRDTIKKARAARKHVIEEEVD